MIHFVTLLENRTFYIILDNTSIIKRGNQVRETNELTNKFKTNKLTNKQIYKKLTYKQNNKFTNKKLTHLQTYEQINRFTNKLTAILADRSSVSTSNRSFSDCYSCFSSDNLPMSRLCVSMSASRDLTSSSSWLLRTFSVLSWSNTWQFCDTELFFTHHI